MDPRICESTYRMYGQTTNNAKDSASADGFGSSPGFTNMQQAERNQFRSCQQGHIDRTGQSARLDHRQTNWSVPHQYHGSLPTAVTSQYQQNFTNDSRATYSYPPMNPMHSPVTLQHFNLGQPRDMNTNSRPSADLSVAIHSPSSNIDYDTIEPRNHGENSRMRDTTSHLEALSLSSYLTNQPVAVGIAAPTAVELGATATITDVSMSATAGSQEREMDSGQLTIMPSNSPEDVRCEDDKLSPQGMF